MGVARPELPELGELVVATVKRIQPFGAYVALDEYGGREGLLHISEISSTWVRNIRNHIREKEKLVLQILRIDPARGQIDLSLRRVSKDERRKKLEEWKKARKAEILLKGAHAVLKLSEEEMAKEVAPRLLERYGSLYAGLEAAARRGAAALVEAGLPEELAEVLAKVAAEKIAVRGVTVKGVLEITSMAPRGAEEIRSALMEAERAGESDDSEVAIYTIGAPKYRVEVTAVDYKAAEEALGRVVEAASSTWAGHDGKISFSRL